MKILYLNDVGREGGAEKILSLVAKILKDNNYDIEIVFGTGGNIAEKISSYNVKILILDENNKFLKYLYRYFKLIKILFTTNANIIVTNSLFMQIFASPIIKLTNKNLIWHEHNIQPEGFRRRFIRFYANIFPKKIIAVSNAVKNVYKDLNIYNNIEVIYNGIRPLKVLDYEEKKEIKTKLGLKEDDKIILSISRLTEYKGVDILIKAFNELYENKNIKLLILGDAVSEKDIQYKEYLYKLANSNKNILFLGWQKDVYKYLNIADLFVASAKRPDPFPTTILEAMSIGTICIVSDIGGQPEAVGNSRMLFPPNDVISLKDKINEFLLLEEKERLFLKKYLIDRYKNNYTLKLFEKRILDFFGRLK